MNEALALDRAAAGTYASWFRAADGTRVQIAPGLRRVAFAVEDIDAVVAGL